MFLAAETDPILSGFTQLGVAGTILGVLLAFGNRVLKRETERADANAAEVARLNQSIQEKYIPSLLAGQQALSEVKTALDDTRTALNDLRASAVGPAQRRRSAPK